MNAGNGRGRGLLTRKQGREDVSSLVSAGAAVPARQAEFPRPQRLSGR